MHKKIYSNVIFKIIFKDDDDGDERKKKSWEEREKEKKFPLTLTRKLSSVVS